MSVYFIRVGGYFKIGSSDNAERRFENLHKSGTRYTFPPGVSINPADRTLYKVIDGRLEREHYVHRCLDQFAVALEWFLDEPELCAFVDALPVREPKRIPDVREVDRPGGWCEAELYAVQAGRAEREVARFCAQHVTSSRRRSA